MHRAGAGATVYLALWPAGVSRADRSEPHRPALGAGDRNAAQMVRRRLDRAGRRRDPAWAKRLGPGGHDAGAHHRGEPVGPQVGEDVGRPVKVAEQAAAAGHGTRRHDGGGGLVNAHVSSIGRRPPRSITTSGRPGRMLPAIPHYRQRVARAGPPAGGTAGIAASPQERRTLAVMLRAARVGDNRGVLSPSVTSETTPERGRAPRVVLADDDVLLREGLASLLDRSGFDVVGQA